jgi:hypothetical protein
MRSPAVSNWPPAAPIPDRRSHPGRTDAGKLYFACGSDHTSTSHGELHTEVTETGRLGWTDGTGPHQINHAHHPEELRGDPDPPDG